jgi:predicted RNase H-like HicB family nuclease
MVFMATYRVVLLQSEEGYCASCPDLHGCWSEGKTRKQALTNIRIAICEYLWAEQMLAKC